MQLSKYLHKFKRLWWQTTSFLAQAGPFFLIFVLIIISLFFSTEKSLYIVVSGVGSVVALFGFYQNRTKINLELYERRINTYKKCRGAIELCVKHANIDISDAVRLLRDLDYEARFFFGQEISCYMNQLFKKCLELRSIQKKLEDHKQYPPCTEERSKVVNQESDLLDFFIEQLEVIDKQFDIYLSFRHVY
ncbi:MAG: hypothetical protein JJT82_01735 [Legionellaceae bacterium]|nr:hypothetical protein [Legionellaceae bacterium]